MAIFSIFLNKKQAKKRRQPLIPSLVPGGGGGISKLINFAGYKFRAGKIWWVFSGAINKYIRNKGNGAEGAEFFLAGQILRLKNLVGFPKAGWKNLVGIPSDEICPPKCFLDEIFPPPVGGIIKWF